MQLRIKTGGVDPRTHACFGSAVAPSADTDDDREKAALRRTKTQLERDLVKATWTIYRLAQGKPLELTIVQLSKKAHGNFRSFNNWKQAHEIPKLPNLQKFASVVGANVRVLVQDAASEEVLSEGHEMNDEVATLAQWIEELPDDDKRYVRGIVDALRAKSRPSERAEESAGTNRGPRR